jgi:hypothetical protein
MWNLIFYIIIWSNSRSRCHLLKIVFPWLFSFFDMQINYICHPLRSYLICDRAMITIDKFKWLIIYELFLPKYDWTHCIKVKIEMKSYWIHSVLWPQDLIALVLLWKLFCQDSGPWKEMMLHVRVKDILWQKSTRRLKNWNTFEDCKTLYECGLLLELDGSWFFLC